MSLVGRAFVEALKFGVPGGVLLALVLFASVAAADDGSAPMRWSELAVVLPTVSLYGAVAGLVVAYPALIVGSIAEDQFARPWGATSTGLATLAMLLALAGGVGMMSPWTYLPASGIAGYAAVVGWFRIPRILAR